MNEKSSLPITAAITVHPVTNRHELRTFIDIPWRVYSDDPMWVPPLRLERRLHFSKFNPYFKHAVWQAWIAYRGNLPVGRISAQIDQLHRQRYGADTGHFGLLESVEDTEVFAALTYTAETWLSERNTKYVSGPFNFSINQECGVLVDGFDTPPMVMMPHSPKWYGRLLEEQGYQPLKDLLAYWVNLDFKVPRFMRILLAKFSSRIHLRMIRRNQFKAEMEILRNIFNDAWSDNWGFIPFTEAEFSELGSVFRILLRDEYMWIAEVDGVPAAFLVAIPNLNEIFAKFNGNLFPNNWLHLYKHVKYSEFSSIRVPLMGVRKQFRNTPLGITLAFMVIDAPRQRPLAMGIREAELSWILEDNIAMRTMLNSIGSKEYKRYRIYGKKL
ncbi:MAG: N-acetyltransferase [Betaproteobacteria bacterium]|nr:N-acetyltransferase [Betaproteobacteria bacterium]